MDEVPLSRLEAYGFCPHAYALDMMVKEASLPLTGFIAMKYQKRHAFQKLRPKDEFVGPQLFPVGDLKGDALAAALPYKSPKSFGKAMREGWRRYIIEQHGKIHNRDLVWAYDNQWWHAAHQLDISCRAYYEHLLKEGLPIDDLTDIQLAATLDGKKFVVRLGVIRDGAVMEEVETKQMKKEAKKLDDDWIITLKIAAFHRLASDLESYRMKWRIEPGLKIEDVTYRAYSLPEAEAYDTRRTEADISLALAKAAEIEARIDGKDFPPSAKAKDCKACRYNVLGPDSEPVCRKKDPKVDVMHPMEWFMGRREAEAPEVKAPSSSHAQGSGPHAGKTRRSARDKAYGSARQQMVLFR